MKSEVTEQVEPAVDPQTEEKPLPPSAWARWEWITPKAAAQLRARASRQRRIVPALVHHYARQMPDRWLANPELIMVNKAGETIEGQHRLLAVEESGASVWMFVARDVDEDVFPVLNTGRPRGPRDAISIMYRDSDPVALAAAVPMVVAYERGTGPGRMQNFGRLTPQEHLDVLDRHPALPLCTHHSKEIVRLLGKAAGTFVLFLLSEVDPTAAADFFQRIETGDDARGVGARELRERLVIIVGAGKNQATFKAALAIKAWNTERAGRTTSTSGLRWRSAEAFPKPMPVVTK